MSEDVVAQKLPLLDHRLSDVTTPLQLLHTGGLGAALEVPHDHMGGRRILRLHVRRAQGKREHCAGSGE